MHIIPVRLSLSLLPDLLPDNYFNPPISSWNRGNYAFYPGSYNVHWTEVGEGEQLLTYRIHHIRNYALNEGQSTEDSANVTIPASTKSDPRR